VHVLSDIYVEVSSFVLRERHAACGVTAKEKIRDDHSRNKQPNWFVIVVMELTI
jgi:hypothetical protein